VRALASCAGCLAEDVCFAADAAYLDRSVVKCLHQRVALYVLLKTCGLLLDAAYTQVALW
jgi:hypothetical protein